MSLQDGTTTAAGHIAAPAAAGRRLGVALLIIAAAQLMFTLDDTIVNVALPTMQRSLHLSASSLNWVISFYALAFGGLLLAGGRIGDLFGRLRVFRCGISLFALASMAGGLATNETVLVTARVLQGCGAALAAPSALSLLVATFPDGPARTKALSVYGGMAGLGSVIGLLLGGTLTQYASWRWVLFINAPIAVAVLLGTFLGVLVPGDSTRGTLDIPGALTATLGIASLIYALTRGNTNGWADGGTLTAFAAGAVLLLAFAVIERRGRAPLLPLSVIRDRDRGAAYVVLLLLGTGLLALFYLLTLYMQVVRGYSALHTGLAYLPFVVGTGLSVGVAPRLLAKLPAGSVVAAGMVISAAALAWYAASLTPASGYWTVLLPGMLPSGVGTGLVFVAGTALGTRNVAPRDSGVAAGLLNTCIQCGAALGLGALAAIASAVTRSQLPGHALAAALTSGYAAGLLAGAVIYGVGAIVAALAIRARLTPDELAQH
jgi:EmrB/QacA subfamily drug resistance transporter